MQETFSLNETCETWDHSCTARQIWLVDAEQKRLQGILPVAPKSFVDDKGFRNCNFCGRPSRGQLKKCPECGRYFKGTKPYKPLKIDYECEACE